MTASPSLQSGPEPRLSRWERRTEWPLTALAVVFLAAYAWQVLHVSAAPWLRTALEAVLSASWFLFAADYLVRLLLARQRLRFVRKHPLDLLAVLFPVFRQLRVLRLLNVLRVLNRRASTAFRGRVSLYAVTVTVLVSLSAALAVLDAERGSPDAAITSFPDALWWTLTTISTVGYGDLYPVTLEGRLVAALLMVGGIALLGVISGMIASWLLERIRASEDTLEESIQRESDVLHADITLLRAEIARLRAELSARDTS